ncbi:methyltransferase [Alteromonas sp. CYL-A6]|uniref:methyltransferase n=1 Tax=Alteromonas nitratireducens TaxID=3390813 RepID=UPI0034B8F17D
MNTRFSFLSKQLTLVRYPEAQQHKSLQAWDSADELLIEHVDTLSVDGGQCIIFNDDFGVLGTWFAEKKPYWISDSHIAHRSLAANLAHNAIASADDGFKVSAPVIAMDSLAPLPAAPALVMIKIPRTLALLEQQLIALSQVMTPDTRIIAAGKVKSVTSGVLALFEKYIGETSTSLAKKKSRLIFAVPQQAPTHQSPYPTTWSCRLPDGKSVTLQNHANVFSRQSLDIGARFMLEHMQAGDQDGIVDLGCGNGVLGLNALHQAPGSTVHFVDESYMALASARDNVALNMPEKLTQCHFHVSNCLETLINLPQRPGISRILCNPPFHQQNTITDHIAWQMFKESRELLTKGGHLVVVGNRHLDYHQKLKRLFGGVKLLASQRKFVILVAAKR